MSRRDGLSNVGTSPKPSPSPKTPPSPTQPRCTCDRCPTCGGTR